MKRSPRRSAAVPRVCRSSAPSPDSQLLLASPASRARLIAKVFHADPLTCRKCGGKLEIVAYLHDQVAIKQVLAHLGLSPPEESKPPPSVHEVVRVPVDEEGREMEAP